MAKERSAISKKDQWNVESLFPNLKTWQMAFDKAQRPSKPRWPELSYFKGLISEDPETLKTVLDLSFAVDRLLSALYTYAHLRHDEDITHDEHKIAYNRISALIHDFQEETAWIEPELLALSQKKLDTFLASPILKEYRFHLQKIIRVKKHMLTPDKEELLAQSAKALQVGHKAFSAINDADFKFGEVLDGKRKKHELTHAQYGLYLRDQDRTLRENAFKAYHGKYMEYENTLSELLSGQVQSHLFNAKARKYSSCLEAALFVKNIDTEVYHALIKAVHEKIDVLHKYINLRKRVMGLDQLHLYDMYVPLIKEADIRLSYEEAESIIIESTAPLGKEYQNLLKQGLKNDRWVDRYENKNKRSGAYSSGSYDTMPYILMNYKEQIKDVFTLAHEAGHSMHSLHTYKHQPYQYGNYPIFLAEVASTFNEELLMQLLLKKAKTDDERIYLINQKIEDIRGTLFRQTMFAEFELFIHEMAEKDIPLTPKLLKDKYRQLNEMYFGRNVIIDEEAVIEWARIPHFYYNFYVFQYATGISAALALADRVVKGGAKEREEYLAFLKGGSSEYPIEMLKKAGVDMRSPNPVKAAIQKFSDLVDQLDVLLQSKGKTEKAKGASPKGKIKAKG